MNVLDIVNRSQAIFSADIDDNESKLSEIVSLNSFLVVGGAGSIGQAVCKEIFKRSPKLLHVVDISENNLVELVRDLRSRYGYIEGEFKTYAIDCGGMEFRALLNEIGGYDYVLNLSALKHVRSEKDPYTLMRMIEVNVLNTISSLELLESFGCKKYFCVSTDKAANPVNMMGASKKLMEMVVLNASEKVAVSSARFANVAFSDGSLLKGFQNRFEKKQPITAPNDVLRYFLTQQESGELCLMSCLLGNNRETFFPKSNTELVLTRFSDIAINWLRSVNYEPYLCSSEEEARRLCSQLLESRKWPCYFFSSDTTGEKTAEEFFTTNENVSFSRFENIGVIENKSSEYKERVSTFLEKLSKIRAQSSWTKSQILELFKEAIPSLNHTELNKNLDEKM